MDEHQMKDIKHNGIENQYSDDENEKERSFFDVLAAFASTTTAHGFGQIMVSTHFILKIMWLFIFVGCQIGLYTQIYPLIVKYLEEKPIKTRVYLREESSQIFPVVALCNANMIPVNKLRDLEDLETFSEMKEVLDKLRPTYIKPTKKPNQRTQNDSNSNTNSNTDRKPIPTMAKEDEDFSEGKEEREAYDLRNELLSAMGDAVFEVRDEIFNFGHNFFEIIKDCKWKKLYQCDQEKFWTKVWHWRYGNCFVFNMKKLPNTSYARVTGSGPHFGLAIDINIQQSLYIGNELTETAGLILYVGAQDQLIDPYANGYSLAPGLAHMIALSKREFIRVDPFKNSSCRVDKVKNLGSRFFSQQTVTKYTSQLCKDICLASKQIATCGCSDYWLPSLNSNRTCDFSYDYECSNPLYVKATNGNLDCLAACTLPCKETSYEISASSQRFPTTAAVVNNKSANLGGKESLADNLLRVNIYFKKLDTTVFEDEAYYTIESLLGDIGGQLGLWSGFSVFTMFEILIFFVHCFFFSSQYFGRWISLRNKSKKAKVSANDVNFIQNNNIY